MSHFLRLPRELRDSIYDYIWIDVCISTPASASGSTTQTNGWPAKIKLLNTTAPALLQVSKQVSNEYRARVGPAATLEIDLTLCDIRRPRELPIQPRVPKAAVSAAKKCRVIAQWDDLIDTDSTSEYLDWWRACSPEQLARQADMQWTPSRLICSRLKKVFTTVQAYVHSAATLDVNFRMVCMPHPDDLHAYYGSRHLMTGDAILASFRQACLHAPTIWALEHGTSMTWPAPGKLRMQGFLITPLFCAMPENAVEMKANRRALEAGETEDVLQPTFRDEVKSFSGWRLRPTESECNWRGYWPQHLGWRDGPDQQWRCK
ncbi:hypothetical protein LTR85_006362 [Meristemomyces frigidus]|nr:hypothetical protein LTR85_006362 [Meristemomyces frigidus]